MSDELVTLKKYFDDRTPKEKLQSVVDTINYEKDNLTKILTEKELLKVLKALSEAESQIRIAIARISREENERKNTEND